jgi:hypothetical protein
MMVDDALIPWLLEGDAAIRWQVLQQLVNAPTSDVAEERALIAKTGWGSELLGSQDREGTWSGAIYSPKWTSTTYTLLLLYRFGLEKTNAAAHKGVAELWRRGRFFDGGINAAKTVKTPEVCITAMFLLLATYFGYDDERIDAAVDWLIVNQLDDGGWNCNTVLTGDKHSSFHTTIMVLEAFSELQAGTTSTPKIATALDEGREFFLEHKLFQSHRTGQVADRAFTQLSFPPRWHYDVLRGLDHFQRSSSSWDPRFDDAVDLLRSKQRRDGRWPVQRRHPGRTWLTMERTGGPSRWNTLRALRVLHWADTNSM